MDASKLQWRRPADNFFKLTLSIVVLVVAFVAITLAVPSFQRFASNGLDLGNSALAADVQNLLRNPLAYFNQRSPGSRDSRNLTQLKHRSASLGRGHDKPPHEEVLSNVRYSPTIPPYVIDLVPPPGPDLVDHLPPGPEIFPVPPVSPVIPPPVAPVVTPPGTNPGGGNTTVPEPATWFTLIWGMGLVGFGLRSLNRRLVRN